MTEHLADANNVAGQDHLADADKMIRPWGDLTSEAIDPERERKADAVVWARLGKRFRECTPKEIERMLDAIYDEIAEDNRRIAACHAVIDQFDALISETVVRAEQWANGGAS